MDNIKIDLTERQNTLATMLKLAQAINDGDIDIAQDSEGWHVKVIDPGHQAMAVINVKPAVYECTEPVTFAINVEKALKVLSLAKEDVRILSDGTQMRFIIGGLTRTMSLILPSGFDVRIPTNIEYKATAGLSDASLKAFLTASDFQETAYITVDKGNRLILSARSDQDSCEYVVPDQGAYCEDGEQRTSYASEYLRRISRALQSPMTVEFATDFPLKISISDGLDAQILIAPLAISE